jgi:hypothetical protein
MQFLAAPEHTRSPATPATPPAPQPPSSTAAAGPGDAGAPASPEADIGLVPSWSSDDFDDDVDGWPSLDTPESTPPRGATAAGGTQEAEAPVVQARQDALAEQLSGALPSGEAAAAVPPSKMADVTADADAPGSRGEGAGHALSSAVAETASLKQVAGASGGSGLSFEGAATAVRGTRLMKESVAWLSWAEDGADEDQSVHGEEFDPAVTVTDIQTQPATEQFFGETMEAAKRQDPQAVPQPEPEPQPEPIGVEKREGTQPEGTGAS